MVFWVSNKGGYFAVLYSVGGGAKIAAVAWQFGDSKSSQELSPVKESRSETVITDSKETFVPPFLCSKWTSLVCEFRFILRLRWCNCIYC